MSPVANCITVHDHAGLSPAKVRHRTGLYVTPFENIWIIIMRNEITRVKETSCCFPGLSHARISVVNRQFTIENRQADFCDLIIWRPDGFYDYTGIETEILVLKIENPDSTQPSDSMPKYSIAP